jgi:hypothetical protein
MGGDDLHRTRITRCTGPNHCYSRGSHSQPLSLPACGWGGPGGTGWDLAMPGLRQCLPRTDDLRSMSHYQSAAGDGLTGVPTASLWGSAALSEGSQGPRRSLGLEGGATVTDCQDHAPQSSHHHSWTVDLHHDCSYGICYLQDVGRFHYCFICYELLHLSYLLSVCLVL